MSLLILVVDDEPDVEPLFRQQFRREIRQGAFAWNLRNRRAMRCSCYRLPRT